MTDGPRVVALGGGHGLASSLSAIRRYAGTITAVVSVADDGGSSGRLRDSLGMPPPGDLRRCLSALADPDSPLGAALEHRFDEGDIAGHPLGNLLIAGLAGAGGDFVEAVDEVGRLVGAVGRVLPAANEPVTLTATALAAAALPVGDSTLAVEGQVAVQNAGGITQLRLRPAAPSVPSAVIDAILNADQIVIGPGSLYTSVLATVIVPAIRDALQASAANRVYVCNLRVQEPETSGYSAADHLLALKRHQVPVDVMLCQPGALGCVDEAGESCLIGDEVADTPCVEQPLARADGLAHAPALLAQALADLVACVP